LCTSIQNFEDIRAQTGAQQHKLEPAGVAPRRLGFRAAAPSQGCVPPEERPTPGSRAPRCIESRTPRASPSSRHTYAVRAVDRRFVRDPGRTRAGRGVPCDGGIFAITTTSRVSRPYLRSPAFSPHARHRRSRSPPHPPWPTAGEPLLRVSPARSNRPNPPRTCRSLRHRSLPGIASPSPEPQPAAAATAVRRYAPSPEPPLRRPTPPIASRRAHPTAGGHMYEDWDFPEGLSAKEGYLCETLKSSKDLSAKPYLQ
jgi:hypothetical protein